MPLFVISNSYLILLEKLLEKEKAHAWKKFKTKSQGQISHTTYSRNIKWQKCVGMGLNGFIFKKINQK